MFIDVFMDAFTSWFVNNAPVAIIVIVLIMVIVGVAVYFVTMHYARLKGLEKKVDAQPCESHRNSISALESMKGMLGSVNEQVTNISKWIMHIDDKMIDVLAQKRSPLAMTKIGRELFRVSGAEKAMEENAESLLSELEKRNPRTPFDVEDYAVSVLLRNMSHTMFNEVKNYLYYQPETVTFTDENGTDTDVTLSMFAIVRLMGLDLRDRYLERHPEIK